MYAVFRSGARQYRVKAGDVFNIERIEGDVGTSVTFGDVFAAGQGGELKIGAPLLAGASVTASIVAQARAKKVLVFKFKRRKNYKRMKGHRQYFTRIRIENIQA